MSQRNERREGERERTWEREGSFAPEGLADHRDGKRTNEKSQRELEGLGESLLFFFLFNIIAELERAIDFKFFAHQRID
jgi:hypothetical protein